MDDSCPSGTTSKPCGRPPAVRGRARWDRPCAARPGGGFRCPIPAGWSDGGAGAESQRCRLLVAHWWDCPSRCRSRICPEATTCSPLEHPPLKDQDKPGRGHAPHDQAAAASVQNRLMGHCLTAQRSRTTGSRDEKSADRSTLAWTGHGRRRAAGNVARRRDRRPAVAPNPFEVEDCRLRSRRTLPPRRSEACARTKGPNRDR